MLQRKATKNHFMASYSCLSNLDMLQQLNLAQLKSVCYSCLSNLDMLQLALFQNVQGHCYSCLSNLDMLQHFVKEDIIVWL